MKKAIIITLSSLSIIFLSLFITFLVLNSNNKKLSDTLKDNVNTLAQEKETLENNANTLNNTINNLTNEVNKFSVKYSVDNKTIYEETVSKNANVINTPAVPEKLGYTGTWNSDGKNITADTIIYPVYTPKTYNIIYTTNRAEQNIDVKLEFKSEDFLISYDNYYGFNIIEYFKVENNKFTFLNETYTIGSGYVCDSNSEQICSTSEWTGGNFSDYTLIPNEYNVDNPAYVWHENTINLSDLKNANYIFNFLGKLYKLSLDDKTITDLKTNQVILNATKVRGSINGMDFEYNLKTKYYQVMNTDSVHCSGTALNDTLVVDGVNYTINFKSMKIFKLSTDHSEWIDLTKVPTKTTYTYGETFAISSKILNNVQRVQLSGSVIEDVGENCEGFPQNVRFYGENIHYNTDELYYVFYNCTGDIIVYIEYGQSV